MTTTPKTRDELVELMDRLMDENDATATLQRLQEHGVQCVPVEADFDMCEAGCYDVECPASIKPPHSEMYHLDHGWSAADAHDDFRKRFKAALGDSPYTSKETKG